MQLQYKSYQDCQREHEIISIEAIALLGGALFAVCFTGIFIGQYTIALLALLAFFLIPVMVIISASKTRHVYKANLAQISSVIEKRVHQTKVSIASTERAIAEFAQSSDVSRFTLSDLDFQEIEGEIPFTESQIKEYWDVQSSLCVQLEMYISRLQFLARAQELANAFLTSYASSILSHQSERLEEEFRKILKKL